MISTLDIPESKLDIDYNICSTLLYDNNIYNNNTNIIDNKKNILSYLILRANLSYYLPYNSYNIYN